MIKDAGSKFDDYSVSPKIREILLQWGYELTEKGFFYQCNKLMSKNELLSIQQIRNLAKNEKTAEFYLKNKESIKGKSNN